MTVASRPDAAPYADVPLRIDALREAYEAGTLTPAQVMDEVTHRIAARGDDGVWIALDLDSARRDAIELGEELDTTRPLWGIPFAVKDNIDIAGWETTAACPDFAYRPVETATAVRVLQDAGAILVGKTNLDQFATGLNGTRSPYGIPSSVTDASMISGGSSSGSAVAVAAGLVAFALGTDTAGSGRVPAALNGIVGHKPSRGLVSTTGVVPACRSLDCVSVFAHSADEAAAVVDIMSGVDPSDPWTRPLPGALGVSIAARSLRLAIPATPHLSGEHGYDHAWDATLSRLRDAGIELSEIDIADFVEAGQLLYDGPWIAERLAAAAPFLAESDMDAVHPVVGRLLKRGRSVSGTDVFDGLHRLRQLHHRAHGMLSAVDALLTPTVSTTFSIQEMLADPIERNSQLGHFTTFGNLLDLAAIALPTSEGRRDRPFGVSLMAPAGSDARLHGVSVTLERILTPARPDQENQPRTSDLPGAGAPTPVTLPIAVVGAHLSGMPLHGELISLGARMREATVTAAEYRLYALETAPPKPGLVRVGGGGSAIEVEVYDLPMANVGSFLAGISSPLGLGSVRLANGEGVHGFLCEAIAVDGAPEVTSYGGWRSYVASR
jgi:allophanate hydrolase